MSRSVPFYSKLSIGSAFLGARTQRLANLVSSQGDEFFRAAGIVVPAQAVSTLLLLREYGPSSLVEVAAALNEPHQVTAKRTAQLQGLSMLTCKQDPNDGRRKLFRLTRKGNVESELVEARCKDALRVFEGLNRELDIQLGDALDAAYDALARNSMLSRSTQEKDD